MLFPWSDTLTKIANQKPTLGALVDLTEETYNQLLFLIPDTQLKQGRYSCTAANDVSEEVFLYLDILEQTPYTTHLHLTYHFNNEHGKYTDPDVYLRVYHDAKQLEVLSLKQDMLPVESLYEHPGLENKWQLLLFLNRWIVFCVAQGYLFKEENS